MVLYAGLLRAPRRAEIRVAGRGASLLDSRFRIDRAWRSVTCVRRMRCMRALLFLATSCAGANPSVRVEAADGFVPPRSATVSIFGVFRDGRMSEAAWQPLSEQISLALGQQECDTGWGSEMRADAPELATSVDSETRELGVTDALLARLAPQALGDFVMTLLVYRAAPSGGSAAVTRSSTVPPRARVGGMGGRGRRFRAAAGGQPSAEAEAHVFELSGSLYSVRQKRLRGGARPPLRGGRCRRRARRLRVEASWRRAWRALRGLEVAGARIVARLRRRRRSELRSAVSFSCSSVRCPYRLGDTPHPVHPRECGWQRTTGRCALIASTFVSRLRARRCPRPRGRRTPRRTP